MATPTLSEMTDSGLCAFEGCGEGPEGQKPMIAYLDDDRCVVLHYDPHVNTYKALYIDNGGGRGEHWTVTDNPNRRFAIDDANVFIASILRK